MESTKQIDLGVFEILPPLAQVFENYPIDAADFMDPLPSLSDEELDAMELDYHRTYGRRDFSLADTEEKVAYRSLLR